MMESQNMTSLAISRADLLCVADAPACTFLTTPVSIRASKLDWLTPAQRQLAIVAFASSSPSASTLNS
jgi:hypothetical protein